MLNSQQASELISKSLHGQLSAAEQQAVDEALAQDPAGQSFARLAQAIDQSVAGVGSLSAQGDPQVAPGLSAQAKSRLRDSVMEALGARLAPTLHPEAVSTPAAPAALPPAGEDRELREARSQFELIREIGTGGLGRVWLARDRKLNRKIALKEMRPETLHNPKAWQRFQREAEITGQLEHPNVISLYQFGNNAASGEPFYAMRFVGKRTLADAIQEYHERCRSGACDALVLHRLLTAFLDVCQAIAYAHSRGVIHRDLKPENVALDNFGQVIVLDWGLAKIIDDGELGGRLPGSTDLSDSALAHTMDGEVIGTPLYMSPEQAAGDLESVDKQTDVYGLGAILFAILTGSAPHETSLTASENQVQVSEALELIAQRDSPRPRDYRANVPLELEQICMRAMAFKKYARYGSVVDLSNAVERWMVDQGSRQAQYENLRVDGRELRNSVKSAVADLETNVRFMSKLPPIQELIDQEDEQAGLWRERLSQIFSGLLSAKSDFRSIRYCRVEDDQFQELVRVERHSTDHATIRAIPRSRLRSGTISDFSRRVLSQNPDEVFTSLSTAPLCGSSAGHSSEQPRLSLVAGVPVFDETSEEVFGLVLIDCDLNRVLGRELNRRFTAQDVVVACDTFQIIMHSNDKQGVIDRHRSKPLLEVLPQFQAAQRHLQTQMEFIDETDRLVYGVRLWLVPQKHGLMFLLSQK